MITTARQLKDLIRNLSKKKSADAQILMRNYMMELPKIDEDKTTLLQEESTMPLQMVEEETTVLEETTTVLQEDETVVLDENIKNTDKRYELVLNEIIIHTQEII